MKDSNYKLAHLDKSKILSAARKALIAADVQYYAWPPDKQERFRAAMGEEAQIIMSPSAIDDLSKLDEDEE